MENLLSFKERKHIYYILDMKYKLNYGRYLEAQKKADIKKEQMIEAYNELLKFINKYGKFPYN